MWVDLWWGRFGMLQAAWVAGQYADIAFVDQRHFTSALHRVVAALTDPELPVRVDSVVALRTFVEACKGMRSVCSFTSLVGDGGLVMLGRSGRTSIFGGAGVF